jgi:hypothetical protein
VVQWEPLAAVDPVIRPPLVGGAIAAGCEEALEDGEEDGPLDVELEAASVQESLDNPLASNADFAE